MTTTTYLIIGGIALAFIAYMLFLKNMMKKRNQEQLASFDQNNANEPLTEVQKRLLAFGAILFYARNEKILGIRPEKNLSTYSNGLAQQWEITNTAEAKETLSDLLALKRSDEFETILNQSSKEFSVIQNEIADGLGIKPNTVAQVNSAYAWDICRAVSLVKWCYWVGYLTEDETWAIMQKASEIATTKGDSWEHYTISFLLGRTIQGFDLDDIIVEAKQLFTRKGPSLRKIEDIDVYTKYNFK